MVQALFFDLHRVVFHCLHVLHAIAVCKTGHGHSTGLLSLLPRPPPEKFITVKPSQIYIKVQRARIIMAKQKNPTTMKYERQLLLDLAQRPPRFLFWSDQVLQHGLPVTAELERNHGYLHCSS